MAAKKADDRRRHVHGDPGRRSVSDDLGIPTLNSPEALARRIPARRSRSAAPLRQSCGWHLGWHRQRRGRVSRSRLPRFGAANVIGVRMPYRTSSADSLARCASGDRRRSESRSAPSTSPPPVDGYTAAAGGDRGHAASPGQRDGAAADDGAIRRGRGAARHSARHRQQERTAARLFHLARRRRTAGQSDWRPVQDAGAASSPQASAYRHPSSLEAGERRPRGRSDRRGRFPGISVPGAPIRCSNCCCAASTDERDSSRPDSRRKRSRWCASVSMARTGKRRLPSVAMVSQTAIGEYYLRPVDY